MHSPEPSSPPVMVRRILPAPPSEVFAAWTDPESVREWMSPVGTATLSMDLRVGGRFRLVMASHDLEIEHVGEYQAIEPPSLLQFTWRSEFTQQRETLVTVRFTPHGQDETEVVLVHELLTAEQARSHADGWGHILDRLDTHLHHGRKHGR